MIRQKKWREAAREAGFSLAGITLPTLPGEESRQLDRWLARGMHGDMEWLTRSAGLRRRPEEFLPGAKTVLMVGHNTYHPPYHLDGGGRVAVYALGRDYHRYLKTRLLRLEDLLRDLVRGKELTCRRTLDAHPVLERALAREAGLGWIGRQSQLIHPRFGPWLLLGGLFLSVVMEPGPAVTDPMSSEKVGCGSCRNCQKACPTGALVEPGVVDSRLCLSYWSIEAKGAPPAGVRRAWGDRLFGCDACLEACPFGKKAPISTDPDLAHHPALSGLTLEKVLHLDDKRFDATFTGTPLRRAGVAGLIRNATLAAAGCGRRDLLPAIGGLLTHPAPAVRTCAAWAIGSMGGSRELLQGALAGEREPSVQEEIQAALGSV